jgi:protein kinase A
MCIEPEAVRYIGASSLKMLELLHHQKIIYRDLKPENIVIAFDTASLHLIDFGFAKILQS